MKIIDLHTHSNYSDGTLSPSELVAHAKSAGLSALALTDHDTAAGIDEAKNAAMEKGVELIAGVEMVAEYEGSEIHVLGYFIDYKGQYFINKLKELAQIRADRNERLLKRLNAMGFELSESELRAVSGSGTLTRLHFAKVMAEKGYAKSANDAYRRYLDTGCPAFVVGNTFDYAEVIGIVKNAGGVSALAHPYSYKWAGGEVINMLERLRDAGLDGVEAIYPTHDKRQTSALIKAAERLGLEITGGSDFHGSNKPNIKIGTGMNNISVSYEILENLKKIEEKK